MKIQLLSAPLLSLITLQVMAQCNPAVPSNAVVVNSTQTINGGFDPIWVCSNDTLHSDGGFHNIFLEPGALMTTSGGIDTIYVKPGAKFFMNGGIHVIYYVNASDISIAGGIPTQSACPSLTYNYANAPTNGCALLLSASFQSSDSSVCTGECINFSDQSTNATSWAWSFPGANPSVSTDENPQNICYETSGSYDVTLIASNSGGSDTLTVTNFITANPPVVSPVLTQSSDTIFSTQGYATYQWYFEGNLITGANNYFYVASENGTYSVVVTSNKGCGEATAEISFVFTDIAEMNSSNNSFSIFPNPANAFFMLQFNGTYVSSGEICITDCVGKNITQVRFPISIGSNEFQFDVSSLPAGNYFLKCNLSDESFSKKIIISH